jgi:hypothetical protein
MGKPYKEHSTAPKTEGSFHGYRHEEKEDRYFR